MSARIEVTQDEIAEKIDELADLCEIWQSYRKRNVSLQSIRAAIVMTCQDVAALVRVMEVGR